MKYFTTKKKKYFRLYPIVIFTFIVAMLCLKFKAEIYRSVVNINMASLYVELIDTKARLINSLNGVKNKRIDISLSANNYIKLQKERSKRLSKFLLHGSLINYNLEKFNYYKSNYLVDDKRSKSEIKLIGINPDHYRNSDGHSFRLKLNGGSGFGNQTFNFLNPRTRDYITDPLFNLFYNIRYGGIKINYEPVEVYLNKIKYGLFYKEDFFDKYLIENNERRESVIFEVINDVFNFNHLGIENEFEPLANEIVNLYSTDYTNFLTKVDLEYLKSIIMFSLVINETHPILDINLHWYFNPASGFFEPTFREGMVYPIEKSNFNIKEFIYQSKNKIVIDLFQNQIEKDFEYFLLDELNKLELFIHNNNEYKKFKKNIIGYNSELEKREIIILNNIKILKSLINVLDEIPNEVEREKIVIAEDLTISDDLIIKSNQDLVIEKGTNIFLNNANIRIYGNLYIKGEKNLKVNISGTGDSFGTVYVSGENAIINHTNFKYLSNSNSKYSQPAAVTFYEVKNINIRNSSFVQNMNGDDYLNFFRSKNVYLYKCLLKDVLRDAIDSDFSNITLKDIEFNNVGNDALDGSGSNIIITNSKFSKVQDKAISAGEKSSFTVSSCEFNNNEIALVVKDESLLKSSHNLLKNNRLDFASFKKKKIYYHPKAFFEKTMINNYLIEEMSDVNGLNELNFTKDVELKLYGNEYGKSSN